MTLRTLARASRDSMGEVRVRAGTATDPDVDVTCPLLFVLSATPPSSTAL